MINAKAKLEDKDFTMAKNYKISIADIEESEFDIDFILENLSNKKFTRVPVIEDVEVAVSSNKTIENGQLAVLKTTALPVGMPIVKALLKEKNNQLKN